MIHCETDERIANLRLSRAPAAIAVGVSGGKDSCALGLFLDEWLREHWPAAPRILIHSDLGRTEWKDSLPTCERLAKQIGWELVVVRRKAGDMLQRWQDRWKANCARYVNLECVKLILPWSTASMRFCTAELKRDVICADLVKRFPGTTIVSASGIRRDESNNRKKAPITKVQGKLTSHKWKTAGFDWHPILGWTKEEVFTYCENTKGFPLHEAYSKYGSSRVSCAFCILGSKADLIAAAGCEDNHDLYRMMVDLEIESTFAFKEKDWLGDVSPHLLTAKQIVGLLTAKRAAEIRQREEAQIPKHLEYVEGWPTCMPTSAEAKLLAEVRTGVGFATGLSVKYTTRDDVLERYAELMAEKAAAEAVKAAKEAAKAAKGQN